MKLDVFYKEKISFFRKRLKTEVCYGILSTIDSGFRREREKIEKENVL